MDHTVRRVSDPDSRQRQSLRASNSTASSGRHERSSSRSSGRQSTIYEEHAKKLKQQLLVANKQFKDLELRAADTEQQVLALATQLKLVNDARINAVQEAAKATEELGLYKIQLQHAHQEIRRAQKIINEVDQERYDAEKAAAEARTLARRYQRDLLMIKAMEEGRKLGMQEGLEQGRVLGLREGGGNEGRYEEDYSNDYFDYTTEAAELRPRSLLLAPNEDIVVHPPRPPTTEPPPPTAPNPVPVPPPEPIQHVPENRPRSFRSPSPSVHHAPIAFPPEGYIPIIDEDNIIRIPPPHELGRPPPTPERGPSPQLPQEPQEDLRPNSRSHRRRLSSSSFGSTSTFSNAAGPSARHEPLSAIPEVLTPYASPLPQSADSHALSRQPSLGGVSHRSGLSQAGGNSRQPTPSIHSRPPSVNSNTSRSLRPAGSVQGDHRKSSASSSAPGISVVPPSRPDSFASQTTALENNTIPSGGTPSVSRPTSMVHQLFGSRPIGQEPSASETTGGFPSPHPTPKALPILMPGGYGDQSDRISIVERPGSSNSRRLVDDDAMSARSGDTLTTPQVGRRSRHLRTSSFGSLTTPPPDGLTGWEDALRNAGSPVPMQHAS